MAFRASLLLLRRPREQGLAGAQRSHACRNALPALLCGLLGCADLTRPPQHRLLSDEALAALQPKVRPSAVQPADAPSPSPPEDEPPREAPQAGEVRPAHVQDPTAAAGTRTGREQNQISAAHILVAYQGATRAKPTVTRSKEDARRLAQSLAERARQPGTDFAQLAREASDGPTGIEGGALPRFGRQQMVKPFSDAAFALQPGEISGVVETNFGFHIIKRTE